MRVYRAIKRLGLDYILPMVAQSLIEVNTAREASEVLERFDSKEVQHLFQKILAKDTDGVFFAKPVFEFLVRAPLNLPHPPFRLRPSDYGRCFNREGERATASSTVSPND